MSSDWLSWVSFWGFLGSQVASTGSGGRDVTPDVLRGFALWGIIVVNVAYFATSVDSGVTSEALASAGDSVAAFLVFTLAQGKFYLIFSFLFGYSSHYVLGRASGGRRRWLLRGIGLVILGIVHATLLFIGDILFLYGLLGLLLLAFYGRTQKVLLRWAWGIYGLFTAAALAIVALTIWVEAQGGSAELESSQASLAYESTVFSTNYLASIPARFDFWISEGIFLVLFQSALTFVAFLAGVLAARWGALNSDGLSTRQLRTMLVWGLGGGLVVQGAFASVWLGNALSPQPSAAIDLAAFFGGFLTAPLLSVGYVGLVVTMVRTRPRALGWLGKMGRMSLTVYLSQSILLSVIFGGWGLGLYQQLPYWGAVVVSLAIALVLSALAPLWLRIFGRGPMESLLTAWSRLGIAKSPSS